MKHDPEIPPFERFYRAHRDDVLAYLRRLLGQRAEDAWQETFLRALRAYDRLEHGRHLRAWVFTIATRVAMDELRGKPRPPVDGEPVVELHRDAFREIEHLTDGLPPTRAGRRRAALRVRPAVRRHRLRPRLVRGGCPCSRIVRSPQTEEEPMTVDQQLDAGFRAAALREGLVDVRYDVIDSPVGELAIAATERGLCRISYGVDGFDEEVARVFGTRVLRSPLDDVRRELDEYFEGTRRDFDLPLDLRVAPFHDEVLGALARVPYGLTTTYGALAARSGIRTPPAPSAP